MASYGTVAFSGHRFQKSFAEHGCVVGMACVYSDLTYGQGLPRDFSYQTRYDYFWPALAHLGEQGILNKEIYAKEQLMMITYLVIKKYMLNTDINHQCSLVK